MPLDAVLHEGHAAAERRPRDEHMRRAGLDVERVDRRDEPGDVVAVDLAHVPPEGPEALADVTEVEHIARVAERLLAVDVDEGDEVREAVMGGEHRGLPYRALVELRVGEDHEDAAPRALHASGQRGSGADREAPGQWSRRESEALDDVLTMRAARGPVAAERLERRGVDPSGLGQRRVERQGGVALREDHATPISAVAAQRASVEPGDGFGDRQARADMPDVRALGL